jgi:hypothetical protein
VSSREVALGASTKPWRGWDATWMSRMVEPMVASGNAARLASELESELHYSEHKSLPVGVPLMLSSQAADYVSQVSTAYRRLILQVVNVHPRDARVRRVLATPPQLRADMQRAEATEREHLDLMRVDFLPQADGSLRILETNANCPGGLLFVGHTARAWRAQLDSGADQPPRMPLEDPDWLYRWLTAVAGRALDTVALFCTPGGNRLELDLYALALACFGVEVFEASPTDVCFDGLRARVGTWPVPVGYLKVGIQDFIRMRPEADDFVRAVRSGALFVQNGQRARWIGDSKLCLAVLSDPALADLFDAADYELVRPLIPWTRNIALCDTDTLDTISRRPTDFVIKHPLDTRGRNVVIGTDVEPAEWQRVVAMAVRRGWVVQERLSTTSLPAQWNPYEDGSEVHHDLAVAVADKRVVGALARSSRDNKLNVAGTGRFHPVLFGR